jgi:peptidylprolyl isomerase
MKKVAIILSLVIGLTGCTEIGDDMSSNTLVQVSTNAGEEPTITAPTGDAPTELISEDIIVGTGAEVLPTSTLLVQYKLMRWSDGSILESSWTGSGPLSFPLANVVVGWKQGLPGAKVGTRRLLVIPPALGYGPITGHPLEKDTLIFAVDILAVS